MAGKSRPSLRAKTLMNVGSSNLSETDKQCIQSVFAKFESLSKADVVEVKHGEWVEWYPPKEYILTGEEMVYYCTNCDAKYSDVEGYKYCPYCGAKMDGERRKDK